LMAPGIAFADIVEVDHRGREWGVGSGEWKKREIKTGYEKCRNLLLASTILHSLFSIPAI
ncbi:MAG TPA: hypothetical protein PLY64_03410, partial [Dokdonella sp.]|nr:hypothetical protein [Dokdonella sp.]